MSMAELEEELGSVRANLESARTLLEEARIPLEAAEQQAKSAWTRRKAALASLAATAKAAQACGLGGSRSTLLAVSRLRERADREAATIRKVIESSHQTCEVFESAWAAYAAGRAEELIVLTSIAEAQISADSPPEEIERKRLVVREFAEIKRIVRNEETQRKQDLGLPDDPHYDPQYDDRELLERRNRRWLG